MEKTQKECDPIYHRAKCLVELMFSESLESAAVAGRQLISRFTCAQLQIPSTMEFGWVQTLDERAFIYRKMELIYVQQNNPSEALVWAERGQMRLFMNIVENDYKTSLRATTDQKSTNSSPYAVGKFDRNDEYAVQILSKTMESCPPNVAIVKYSYSDQDESLVVYLLTKEKMKVRLICDMGTQFGRLFNDPRNKPRKLKLYISTLLATIRKKDDSTAKRYLSVFFHLMLKPELQYLSEACDTLVFAHHGLLSSIPLHALYDDSQQRFLIQLKRVDYIPSIRVLHYCYNRQNEFIASCGRGELKPPFLAGDPEPMGKGMAQLPNAREEAQEVAKTLLGNKSHAFVGKMVTKQAVKEALCDRQLTLLSTHCVDKALILRGQLQEQLEAGSGDPIQQTQVVYQSLDMVASCSRATTYELDNQSSIGSPKSVIEENLLLQTKPGLSDFRDLQHSESTGENRGYDCRPSSLPTTKHFVTSHVTMKATGDNTEDAVHELVYDKINSDLDEEELIRGATMSIDGESDEEKLTVAEIGELRVRSGLVVLDGCGTNEGHVSQEGLLGLGRALLLAGAPMAILTLWSVNDKSTRTLVTGMFENVQMKQLDVLGSLQKAMVDMISKGDKNIYHWAPLIALGSPTMKLPQSGQ